MAIRLGHGEDELAEVHGINVTPFIDVMLVLLIIFMVAAPLATVDIPVNLPASNAEQQERPKDPVYLTVKSNSPAGPCLPNGLSGLSLAIGEDPVAREAIGSALDVATGGKKDEKIFLRADRTVCYGDVVAVMNEVSKAGYKHFSLNLLELREAK
jgi:biopolymer transport protein ExbD